MMKRMLSLLVACACLLASLPGLADGAAWTCINCGYENNGNFCGNCGHARPSCPSCGTKLKGTERFCPECGTALREENGRGSAEAAEGTEASSAPQPDMEAHGVGFTEEQSSVEGPRLEEIDVLPAGYESWLGEDAYCLAVSPDGGTYILCSPEKGVFVLKDGIYRPFTVSENRGVQDEFGEMGNTLGLLQAMIGRDQPAVWSPDGRYAVMLNAQYVLSTMRSLPLVLFDTETAELILTVSRNRKDGWYIPLAACFSENGKTLYYTLFGLERKKTDLTYPGRYFLFAYDLESGETVVRWNGETRIGMSSLFWADENSLMTLSDSVSVNGILEFRRIAGEWHAIPHDAKFYSKSWYIKNFQWNRERGVGLLTGNLNLAAGNAVQTVTGFSLVNAGENWSGLSSVYLLTDEETPELIRISALDTLDRKPSIPEDRPPLGILNMLLSPDGDSVMVTACSQPMGSIILLLISVSDLSVRRISLENGLYSTLEPKAIAMTSRGGLGYWLTDGRLVMRLDDRLRFFRLHK